MLGGDNRAFHHPLNKLPEPVVGAHIPPERPKRKLPRTYLFISIGVLVVILLIVAALVLLGNKKPAQTNTLPKTAQSTAPQSKAADDVPAVTTTVEYKNGFLGVTLTRPDTWKVTESENQDGVRLESPDLGYQTVDGKTVQGQFRLYIRKGARQVDGTYIGRGVAIKPSEKLTYTKPAPGQRTETTLSLFGLDSSDNFAFFLIAGNYNLNKGDTLGPNYGKEAETFIIAGGFSSHELKDDLATNQVSPGLLDSSSAYKQAIDIVKSLQLR